MSEIIITIGSSGSGKSTAIKKMFPDHIVVSPDNYREAISQDYSISGPNHIFDYARIFGSKPSELEQNDPEIFELAKQIVPEDILRNSSNLDSAIFKFAFQRLNELLKSGKDVIFDATTLSAKRWRPLVEIGRKAGASVKALWMTPDEFENDDELMQQLIRNNEERHSIDSLTGKPRGRFTPVPVLQQMNEASLRLRENPPVAGGDDSSFDEVIKVPIKKRQKNVMSFSWMNRAKKFQDRR